MPQHSTLWNEPLVADLSVPDNDVMTDTSYTPVSPAARRRSCQLRHKVRLFADTLIRTLVLLPEKESQWRAIQLSLAGQ